MNKLVSFAFAATMLLFLPGCGPVWTEQKKDGINTVENPGGATLGYSSTSGVTILTVDRLGFKDLNRDGHLDRYEDWRLPADERARDLASKMTIDQIAGLMLYSPHQSIPGRSRGFLAATYNGKSLDESGAQPSDLTDQQKEFLGRDVRHVLITSVQSPGVAATWNNKVQALVEGLGMGIPTNNSSDPRHGTVANAEYNAGAGGQISMWPGALGLAATFNPALVEEFGSIASKEYRALGITTALSPQVDIATDPRWYRTSGTFGEDPELSADIGRSYIDGFQTSSGDKHIGDGWGFESVNAMVKHWPGGGSGEGGRDAHYAAGKYAVYPGKNFDMHLIPFTEGAFKLNGKTGMASAVMPYYTISYDQDTRNHENVGNSYNKYIIGDLLREKYQYDGVVCTDWSVTRDETEIDVFLSGKPWGVEGLPVAARHYKILMAGVDQFGGNSDPGPVVEAYAMGVEEHGEEFMRRRFEQSAVRLLKNIFRTGLFENPYVDVAQSIATLGNPQFMKAGYDAQLKSVVMLKNKNNALPVQRGKTVFIPKQFTPAGRNFLGVETPAKTDFPVNIEIVKKYFEVTDNPKNADYALVFARSPDTGIGYSRDDVNKGGNGYVPISLQYGSYLARSSRDPSLAGGDPLEKSTNRSYKGKTNKAINVADLDMINNTATLMDGKPVIVAIRLNNPMIYTEFEKNTDALLIHFGVQDQALLDLISGEAEPNGLLPLQMPADMETVEKQFEDLPHDLDCYVDTQGHRYDFAFGLNWKGVINDERKSKYKK
jgi:beta-glucosidase